MTSRFQNCHWESNLTKASWRKHGKRLVANCSAQTVFHFVFLHKNSTKLGQVPTSLSGQVLSQICSDLSQVSSELFDIWGSPFSSWQFWTQYLTFLQIDTVMMMVLGRIKLSPDHMMHVFHNVFLTKIRKSRRLLQLMCVLHFSLFYWSEK